MKENKMKTTPEPTLPPYTEYNVDSTSSNEDKDDNDLLPSFELHNSIFNRNLIDEITPDYQEIVPTATTSSIHQYDSVSSTDRTLSNDNVLDNLHKLQKINVPFDVNVKFTKKFPEPFENYEFESPLRQYYPGDTVFGIVTFENKGSFGIPFEMCLVSLECELGIISSKNNKQVRKKIIKMYDLEASYNFLDVEKKCFTCHQIDPIDNYHLGFKSRILEPNCVVKKLFKFKLPMFILDDNCCAQFSEHLKVPPSFGFDSVKYPNTIIDSSKGYSISGGSGELIKVQDYALYGEFSRYYINVQMIGKNLDIYKTFFNPNTTHLYDYIFLKSVEQSFRVGKLYDSSDGITVGISTKSQLQLIQKMAKETMEVLAEREMLIKVGVCDMKDQDEIIFSTSGKLKSPSEFLTCDSGLLNKVPLDKSFKRTIKYILKRELFSKLNGELTVTTKHEGKCFIESFLPKLLETKTNSIYVDRAFRTSTTPIVSFDLEYESYENSGKLPTSLYIEPFMWAIDIESEHGIPFTIDEEFIVQDQNTAKKMIKDYNLYHSKIRQIIKDTGSGIPRITRDALNGMAHLRYQQILIPRLFKAQNIQLNADKWSFNEATNKYSMSVKFPLEFDTAKIISNPKALIPTFQTCIFARQYKVQLNISPKNNKIKTVTLPLTVI